VGRFPTKAFFLFYFLKKNSQIFYYYYYYCFIILIFIFLATFFLPKTLAKLVEFTQCWWNKEWFYGLCHFITLLVNFPSFEKGFQYWLTLKSQVRNNENNGQPFFFSKKKTFGGRLLTCTILKLWINNYFLIINQMLLWREV
jgi:hypothetical protein